MASLIENYGLISNLRGAALVSRTGSRTGSIDWACLPRFDSDACLAGLLGRDDHGCWIMKPGAEIGGYLDDARAWRSWLLNAIAGAPDQLQIMYGIDREHRLEAAPSARWRND